MAPRHCFLFITCLLAFSGFLFLPAGAQEPPAKDADKTFDGLLADAKKDPEKTDWLKLRHAFTETERYQPYNRKWREELNTLRTELRGADPKAAEAALDALMEREGYMRLDAHGLAAAHYRETGQKEKEDLHAHFAQGIASTLFVPGTGLSFERPIEVLFVDEEYAFLGALELKPKKQVLTTYGDHKFDVLEAEPEGGGEPIEFYFNVDRPQKTLYKMFERLRKNSDQGGQPSAEDQSRPKS